MPFNHAEGRYLYAHPEFPGVFVSRQRLYQLRNKALGLCIQCGREAVTTKHCERHRKLHNERNRKSQ